MSLKAVFSFFAFPYLLCGSPCGWAHGLCINQVQGFSPLVFREYSRGQMFFLPPSLDEFVPENHEARIINDVVDTTDLSPLFARYEGGGARAYHPAMMLKVLIYAYSRGI